MALPQQWALQRKEEKLLQIFDLMERNALLERYLDRTRLIEDLKKVQLELLAEK